MEDAVEMIDIGGPSMLRAAAKNFAHVAPLCLPRQYGPVLDELRARRSAVREHAPRLASEAFAYTAAYEASIARWFGEGEGMPQSLTLAFEKVQDLAYGENPHQRAAYYRELGARRHLLSQVEQLHGRALSFINLYDLAGALLLLREFTLPTCVIVKHANPCGVAMAATIEEAYERALASDPLSAFGMVCAVNRPVSAELAKRIAEQFVDVLHAPGFEAGAVEAWRTKPRHEDPRQPRAARVPGRRARLQARARRAARAGSRPGRRGARRDDRRGRIAERRQMGRPAVRVAGLQARLVERDRDREGSPDARHRRGTAEPGGLGADRAREGADVRPRPRGPVLASDAFFPFADGPELALASGVSAIVQPGGSKRDGEVVAAVERAGAVMVFTGRRHFRH